MGTNYYHRTNICEACERHDEHHIGKASAGWTFSFHGERDPDPGYNPLGKPVTSFADWKERLKVGSIFDEHGTDISLEDFVALVESKRNSSDNHTRYVRVKHSRTSLADAVWYDIEGHSFSEGEFS